MAKAFVLAALLALACTQVSASSLSVVSNQTGTWVDLFQAPYNQGPSIMLGLSCTSRWSCYIPGGSNGAGFQMYMFPGVANGVFTPLKMPNPPLMMLAIALGGSASNPGGAVTGVGIGNGVQYPVDNVTFMPSTTDEIMDPAQDVRASKNGKDVLVINAGPNDVLYSSNGGKDFTKKAINVPLASNCTNSRYGAMIDSNTWYVTMGSWPDNTQEGHIQLSRRVSVSRCPKTGKVTRHSRKFHKADTAASSGSSASGCNGFSAQIVKTTDGGNTWTTQFSAASNFYFNAIECVSSTNCVAVGEGAVGVYIYRTTDGQTWKQVFFKAFSSTEEYSLMTVRANEHGHIFVGGSMTTQTTGGSLIMTSVDEGLTWVIENSLPNVAEVSDLSFTPGGYGFATAETIYDTTTILRYDPLHPGPTPPQPPTPTIQTFSQMQCSDAACSVGCRNLTFSAGVCLPMNGGGSAIVTCGQTTLNQQTFQNSGCTGASTNSSMPLNQCLQSNAGGYFENICSNSMSVAAPMHAGKKLLVTRRA